MDNKKIGKLIAKLRKQKGLTQQELGDKFGLGFRAVSRWERGLTMPDISIIKELSKILGISSDELLAGEIKKENKTKKKMSSKLTITLLSIVTIIVIFALVLAYNYNKTYTYNLESTSEEYSVEGQVIIQKDNIKIIINKLNFTDKELLETKIQNYDYRVFYNNKLIFGYGNTQDITKFEKINTIEEFTDKFRINYNSHTIIKRKELLSNGLRINMTFLTEDNKIIEKEIDIKLTNTENN